MIPMARHPAKTCKGFRRRQRRPQSPDERENSAIERRPNQTPANHLASQSVGHLKLYVREGISRYQEDSKT